MEAAEPHARNVLELPIGAADVSHAPRDMDHRSAPQSGLRASLPPALVDLADPRDPVPTPGVRRPPVLGALTSLRFFAALHVFFYHYVRPFDRWGFFASVFRSGYVAVSFFFVLSGFILTYSHAHEYESGRGDRRRFWVARFARLYPVYLLALLLAGLVKPEQLHKPSRLLAYGLHALMLQSWSTHLVLLFNIPAWSLSCEAFFYCVFPLLLLRMKPKSRASALVTIAVWWALAMLPPLYALLHAPAFAMHEFGSGPGSWMLVHSVRRFPPLALPEFLAGMTLGWFYLGFGTTQRSALVLTAVALPLLLLAFALSDHMPYVMLHNGLLIPLECALILGMTGRHWMARALDRPWLLLLGEASYSLYLIHETFRTWTERHFGLANSIGNALWRLAVMLVVSVLLYLGFEKPLRRRILTAWGRRQSA